MFAIQISHLGHLCRQLCPVWGGSPLMLSGCQMQFLFWKPLPAVFQRDGVANTCPSSWCCGSNPILSAISLLLRIFCSHAWGWLICKRVGCKNLRGGQVCSQSHAQYSGSEGRRDSFLNPEAWSRTGSAQMSPGATSRRVSQQPLSNTQSSKPRA